jgi:hypothetical protein
MEPNPTHEAFLKNLADPRYYGDQDENGIDLSLIRENLKLTPLKRLRKADYFALGMEGLRKRVRRIAPEQA